MSPSRSKFPRESLRGSSRLRPILLRSPCKRGPLPRPKGSHFRLSSLQVNALLTGSYPKLHCPALEKALNILLTFRLYFSHGRKFDGGYFVQKFSLKNIIYNLSI
ncbi:hypothetical protein IEQ34_013819 [Dendrobium chrysotoxum]|uniref:Uncharacterized protein n=1 Tax=Dendrobium chrysotoxum TaxID=161865 RepID=A0AAV7G9P2_DENCH|nr:hypothetical protein IEQ34_013819 [Dendrobium chrysotoxum]